MDETRDQSEFNNAINYLNRLNALFYNAGYRSMILDMTGWYHTLMVLFREISTECTNTELLEFEVLRKKLAGMILGHTINSEKNNNNHISKELYDNLHIFEMRLRQIVKSSGLQQKIKDSPMTAVMG